MDSLTGGTIGECLREQADKMPEHSAMRAGEWSCSYRRFEEITELLAIDLMQRGLEKGDRIGILGVNSPNWVFTFLAAVKIGVVPFLLNTCSCERELEEILNRSSLNTLFYGKGHHDLVYKDILSSLCKRGKRSERMLPIDREGEASLSEADFPASYSGEALRRGLLSREEAVRPEDTACVLFTSGSTAAPKGVMLCHQSLLRNAEAMRDAMGWGEADRMCLAVPLFHTFGITAGILACILSGASMEILPYYRTEAVWNAVEEKHCTILNGVPSMFLAMVRKEGYRGRDGSSVRSGIIAGSAFSAEEYQEIKGKFSGMDLRPSYGMTETSPCVTIVRQGSEKEILEGSCGLPIPGVRVRIIRSGRECACGESGEVQVKGYNLMQGYFDSPEETARAFTEDGWLHTGDLGYLDQRAALHISGRMKDIIIRSGENISPAEIEEELDQFPGVQRVKVVGVKASVRQEEVVACMKMQEGITLDPDAVQAFLAPRLSAYKMPTYIIQLDCFPETASGKPDIKAIREMAEEAIRTARACYM